MSKTITDLPYQAELVAIETGDMLIMLKEGGGAKVMTVGIDEDLMNGLSGRDVETFSDEERDVYDRAEAMFLLMMAYKSPIIMDALREISQVPEGDDVEKLNNVVRLHS